MSFASVVPSFSRSGSGTYFDSAGVLQAASTDVARLAFDPANSNAPLGVLIEPAATNRLTYSNDFTQAKSTSNATIGSETADSRFGTIRTITDSSDGGNTVHRLNILGSGGQTSGTFGIRECILKAGTISHVVFAASTLDDLIGDSNREAYSAGFNLSTGAVNFAGVNVAAGIVPLGDGYYYCYMLDTVVNALTGNARGWSVRPASGATVGATSYTGAGTGAFTICHVSYREGASIRQPRVSPIQTTSAQVTCGADTATLSDLTNVIVAADRRAAGLVRARTPVRLPAASSAYVVAQLDDGSESNRYRVEWYNDAGTGKIRFVVTAGGSAVATIVAGTVAANTDFALAWRADLDDFAVSLDGAALVTDTGGTPPAGITTLRYGRSYTGEHWGSTIDDLRLAETLSDAQLRSAAA